MVRESQFGYDAVQVPLWANTPTGRLFYQYGRWGTQRTRYLWKHVFEPALFGEELVGADGKRYKVRRLKPLARELDCPGLCLAQLNRQVEQEKSGRPRLSHLRESGSIEQDADIVIFVHRQDMYRPDQQRDNMAEVYVAKNRNGPTGTCRLTWLAEFTQFEPYSPRPGEVDFQPMDQEWRDV